MQVQDQEHVLREARLSVDDKFRKAEKHLDRQLESGELSEAEHGDRLLQLIQRQDRELARVDDRFTPSEILPPVELESGPPPHLLVDPLPRGMYGEPITALLPTGDVGNAQRFRIRWGKWVRYVPERDRWIVWDGRIWVDDSRLAYQLAMETIQEGMVDEVDRLTKLTDRDALLGWRRQSLNRAHVEAMLALAQTLPSMSVAEVDLDPDADLLNVANGVVDLTTGDLRPHDPRYLMTRYVPINYDPRAEAPRFMRFLDEVQPETEAGAGMHDYLQLLTGASLYGHNLEQFFVLNYGEGQNGKSVYLNVLRLIAGTADDDSGGYARATRSETILTRDEGKHTEDIARLVGSRIVTSAEASSTRAMNEENIKNVTGGDPVNARYMRQNTFAYRPIFNLWFATNVRPPVKGTYKGIWRRMIVVPWDIEIPDAEVDDHLFEELRANEAPGILAWAVRGAVRWNAGERVKDESKQPEKVRNAKSAYRAENDAIGRFLEDNFNPITEPGEGNGIEKREVYSMFQFWAHEQGLKYVVHFEKFCGEVLRKGIQEKRPREKGRRYQTFMIRANGPDAEGLMNAMAEAEVKASGSTNRMPGRGKR